MDIKGQDLLYYTYWKIMDISCQLGMTAEGKMASGFDDNVLKLNTKRDALWFLRSIGREASDYTIKEFNGTLSKQKNTIEEDGN